MTQEKFNTKVKAALSDQGRTRTWLANELGVTRQTLNNKLTNLTQWTLPEMEAIERRLHL